MGSHKVYRFRSHLFSGYNQVAFVFPIFIIHHYYHFSLFDIFNSFFNGAKFYRTHLKLIPFES